MYPFVTPIFGHSRYTAQPPTITTSSSSSSSTSSSSSSSSSLYSFSQPQPFISFIIYITLGSLYEAAFQAQFSGENVHLLLLLFLLLLVLLRFFLLLSPARATTL